MIELGVCVREWRPVGSVGLIGREVEIGVSRISYPWIFLKRIFWWPFFIFLFGFYEGTGLRG